MVPEPSMSSETVFSFYLPRSDLHAMIFDGLHQNDQYQERRVEVEGRTLYSPSPAHSIASSDRDFDPCARRS